MSITHSDKMSDEKVERAVGAVGEVGARRVLWKMDVRFVDLFLRSIPLFSVGFSSRLALGWNDTR
jgi:hypothetical protein